MGSHFSLIKWAFVARLLPTGRLVQRLGVGAGFYRVEMGYKANGDLKETKIGILSAHDCAITAPPTWHEKGIRLRN